MKKTNQATLLLVALLGLTACGGGSSNETQNDVKQDQTNTQPQKKDITISGSVEKGPFVIGSTVTINILDENGENTDSTIVTKTTDDLGNFEFKVPEGSIIQITAAGYYRNEITGALSEGQLSLRSIYKATSDETQSANVNLLTHLTSNRVLELIKAGETDFNKAISQAEEEFSTNFQTVIARSNNESFSDLSIFAEADSDDNAYLLTLSSMLYQHAIDLAESNKSSPEAELTSILNVLESDFGNDGKVDNTDKLTAIQLTQKRIDPAKVTQYLIDWLGDNKQFTVPDINAYIDTDLDGIANNKDDDDDNDGIADEDDTSQFVADFVIENQNISLAEDKTVSIEIATNNPLGTDEPIKFELMSDVSSGSLKVDYPNISYTPVENYNGKDEFSFKLIQGNVESKLVTFSIDVTAVNDAPVINGEPELNTTANEEYRFLPNISDIENDSLSVTVENLPSWLTLDSVTGELKGTPTNADAAVYSDITMSVNDGNLTTDLPSFSLDVSYSILNAPQIFSQQSKGSENHQQEITLSWEDVEFAQSYNFEISLVEDFSEVLETKVLDANSISLLKEPNKYYWRVSTINPHGQTGPSSEKQIINAGVFETTLGGSSNDYAYDMIPARNGGYFVLGATQSQDINADIDSKGDDWIIKLNESGEVSWQYFHHDEGREKLTDIIELEDNSLVAIGKNWNSNNAFIIKISQEGEELLTYEHPVASNFNSHAYAHNKLYVSLSTFQKKSDQTTKDIRSIHSFDLTTGELSSPIQLPNIEGQDLTYFSDIFTDHNDNLVIAGNIYPTGGDPMYYLGGVFLMVLDESMNATVQWHNSGSYKHLNAAYTTQLKNQNYAILGQAQTGASLAVIGSDGTELINDNLSHEISFYGYDDDSFGQTEDGTYYLISFIDNYEIQSLVGLDSNLTITSKEPIGDVDYYYSARGLLVNEDNTITVLLNQTLKTSGKSDILIKRIKP
ncbi:Ig-like domain-containing protein [Pseudoalteromonas sp. BZB3]|uniref:putative Ig domain-containing protein n=1 Tax=Pseudoalteromonas sp. BZB3 TaxID=3136670 RepID=UPI0032C3D88D